MNFFKGIAKGIGWLTASLVGIGAILYSCGYFINLAQSNFLGLDLIAGFDREFFIQEGGSFFTYIGITLANRIVDLLCFFAFVVFVVALLVISVVCLVMRKNIRDLRVYFRERYLQLKWVPRLLRLGRLALYIALFPLLFSMTDDPKQLNSPLEISGLLYYSKTGQNNAGTILEVAAGDISKFGKSFDDYFRDWLIALIALLIALYLSARWRYRLIAVAPFVIIWSIYTIYLPMLYGVLHKKIRFPVVSVISDCAPIHGEQGGLHLLNKTDSELILWDSKRRKVLWVPMKEVKAIEVSKVEEVFSWCKCAKCHKIQRKI